MKPTPIFVLMLLLAGCATDITHDNRYDTDYVVGGMYRVQHELLLLDLNGLAIAVPRTEGELGMDVADARKSIQDFVNYVPAGTLIRFERLIREHNVEMGDLVWAKGRFVDGPYAGKVVELYFASKTERTSYPHIPQVDSNALQRIDPTESPIGSPCLTAQPARNHTP
jgi:hypothetical protein